MPETFPPPNYIPVASSVPGIEVYAPAPPEAAPQPDVIEFTCPQCGGTTAFSVEDGGLTCTHCGYHQAPQKAAVGRSAEKQEFTVEALERSERGWGKDRKDLECQSCGAYTSVPAESLSHTCPFCGSNQVIQRQASQDMLRPRFLIPFKIEAKACENIARQWLGSSWMTPSALKNAASLSSFTGIYLPFWTFSAKTNAAWKAEVGHTVTETYTVNGEQRTRTRTEWRWESGHVQLHIEDLVVSGTKRISNLLLGQVNSFDMSLLTPFESQYLAGFQALAYDVQLEPAWETGRQQMREQTREACEGQASSSQIRNFSMELDFADETWRYVLMPVYLTAYTFQNQTFQVIVNGQTGLIAGQRPVDWNKIWLAVALLLAPGLLLGLVGLLTLLLGGVGIVIGGVGFILLIIGLAISAVIYRKAQSMDDI
jgi:predicted RNA-binding Zn-ribbon protein involved in translation (DUF1610 family)